MNTQRRLMTYLRPHTRVLIAGLLCAAITAAITVGIGWFIKIAFDAMGHGDTHNLTLICIAIVAVFVVKGVVTFGQNYFLSLVGNRIATRLREEIYAHLHTLSLSFFNRRRTGAIMSTLTNDVPAIQNAAMSLRDVVAAPITIVVSIVWLIVISWKLSLISFLFIPFMAVVISRISKRLRSISTIVQNKLADVSTVLEETVAGVRIIKSFATEQHEISRFVVENNRTLSAVMNGVRKSAQLRPLTDLIGAFGIALVLYLGGNYVAQSSPYVIKQRENWIKHVALPWVTRYPGRPLPAEPLYRPLPGGMTQGSLVNLLYLLNVLARSAGDIGGIMTLRAQALAAARRIFDEVLDVEPEVQEKPDPLLLPTLKGHIKFEDVSFRYHPDGPDVLKNISFEVKPGEVIALVGKSGSGKSTMVDLIPRFYDPVDGRILIDEIDIRDVKLDTLRRQIGIVPQETWLFAGTLRDNITYGNRAASEAEIHTAAYAANAAFVEGMPLKFDTIVGERGIRLSGGERQRIAIARAILMDPRLLILDEATSSLDASSEALVQDALDELMKGRTTIVIAHRLSTIINADRILAMQDGRIVEMGSHRDLVSAGGYYARLYETQLQGYE